jgi:gluconokinase
MIIVVIGVTGAGKSTVGAALAERLEWRFLDADDFHGEANWKKLERGVALTDADRQPWLERLRDELQRALARNESLVLACSALRQAYRDTLVPASARPGDVRFIHLDAERQVLEARLSARTGHRASATLLRSQLDTFEPAPDALRVDATHPPDRIVQSIVSAWALE